MSFPTLHKRLILITGIGLLILLLSGIDDDSDDIAKLAIHTTNLETPNSETNDLTAESQALIAGNQEKTPATNTTTQTDKVRAGDSLAKIFARNGHSAKDLHQISSTKLGKQLKNIFPGNNVTFLSNEDQLVKFIYHASRLESLEFTRAGKGFAGEKNVVYPDRVISYKHATIDDSLFLSSQRAGLPDKLTMRLAQIFQWDIDFVLDIRPGDQFFVLYEELYLDGENIGTGAILAADFINQQNTYSAVAFTNANGNTDFYTPKGVSMRKAFLRAPVEFSRISSSFNLRRRHPLHKTIRPHRGIDYAAPRGTPILGAGDGRIKTASRTNSNGRYIVIQHGEQFVTKYLHLSKFGKNIKSGRKVRQGQIIGYVGSTGWATGPHLHYEFLVNGTHKNPRTVKLPKAEPVAERELATFRAATRQYALLLNSYKDQITLVTAQ
jgi:murein DD-endopeptidase MepM/ murein hydrolase activator NlpD